MRYLLNSAVLTGPGIYHYRLVPREEAVAWLWQGDFVSRVGYLTTAEHIVAFSGILPKVSREYTTMESGDEALVVRLKYRIQDPAKKITHRPGLADWEYGVLKKEV